ncbi:His Kinase A (phospho-acceptor) domain-containing protein [Siphonobacter aquaeclarae]|uniref:histidine kinase n=1 Tax=Siphonobacter aquaeclarae TaxID=563176 RepID=A0A1G9I4L7_9BACT|nr:His Kinase A (phospho-acceptor) domain-containing protein [Siphonobacter aquaeclarae]
MNNKRHVPRLSRFLCSNSDNPASVCVRFFPRVACFSILLFSLFSARVTTAQVFLNYLDYDNAPVSTSMGIAQDHEGFMWFATINGLYRYDTRTFRLYAPKAADVHSIGSSYINDVRCDSHGTIWAATSGGLSRYDRETDSFTTFRHDEADPHTLSSNNILAIEEDRERKGYWVGSSRGLDYVQFRGGKAIVRRLQVSHLGFWAGSIHCVAETADGTIWAGTYDGLLSVNRDGKNMRLFRMQSGPDYPSRNEFNAIYADQKGSIWLGSNRAGLIRFDITGGTFHTVQEFGPERNELPNVSKILPDKNGKFWVATWSGLARFDPVSHQSVWYTHREENPLSLSDNLLYSLCQDHQGGIWTGNYYTGISYLYPNQSAMNASKPFGAFKAIQLGKTPEGNIWAVNERRNTLSVYNVRTKAITDYPLHLPYPFTYNAFHLDDGQQLWCGGMSVLTCCNLRTGERKDYPIAGKLKRQGGIKAILCDSRGRMWIADPLRLMVFDPKTGQFHNPGGMLSGSKGSISNIYYATEDSRGNIWLGGREEVLLLKSGATTMERIPVDRRNEPGLPVLLLSVCEDAAGRMWFAFGQHGLQVYNPAQKRLERDSAVPEMAEGLQSDPRGYLWISNSSRLIRYHPEKKTKQLVDYRDGLPLHGILRPGTCLKDNDNRLYWATTKGVFSHLPVSRTSWKNASSLIFTSLKLFNTEVLAGDSTQLLDKAIGEKQELTFRHDQNSFTLSFALLSYFRSDRNQYAYKLDGFGTQWSYTDNPSVTFTHLPPGTYTLLVNAADGEGLWNKTPRRLQIRILPPWWQTWYAYVLYFASFFGLLFWAIRFFWMRKTLQKDRELFLAKLDFFTNISHEIRTHLTLIAAPLEKASAADDLPVEVQTYIGYARTNSDTLMSLVNELLDFRKIQSGNLALEVRRQDLAGLIRLVLPAFEYKAIERGITTHVTLGEGPLFLWYDSAQLQKVLYNLLSNAYKYTRTGGNVWITVSETSGEVRIAVKDDGKGILPEHLRHLFTNFYQVRDNGSANTGYGIGLALAYEIAIRHRGDLTVTSVPAKPDQSGETCFTLILRKGSAHFLPGELREPLAGQKAASAGAEPQPERREGEHTILLIEDNADLRAFEREALRQRFTILEAGNGAEGLALAKVHVPDLIICDIMLPGMDGLSVCRTLKAELETNHIPVILLSARGAAAQVREGLEAGADDYLVKPFDLLALELKIDNLIHVREMLKLRYSRSLLLEPDEIVVDDKDGRFIEQLKELVMKHLPEPDFGVNEMALEVGTSVSVLYRKLRALTGMTVNDFMKNLRMKRAMQLLESGAYHINEVSLMVGYESTRHFSREFKKAFGKTPNEVRKKESPGRS